LQEKHEGNGNEALRTQREDILPRQGSEMNAEKALPDLDIMHALNLIAKASRSRLDYYFHLIVGWRSSGLSPPESGLNPGPFLTGLKLSVGMPRLMSLRN